MRKNEFAAKVLEVNLAFAQAHVVEETGHNDGKQIDRLEKVWGLKGEPYCAMGQYWAFAKAYAQELGLDVTEKNAVETLAELRDDIAREYLRFDPRVAVMMTSAMRRGQFRTFNSADRVHRMVPGDLVVFDFGEHGSPAYHIGMFARFDGNQMHLVEWNTSPPKGGEAGPKSNDPRGGCFVRHRHPDPDFVLGWIAWQVD